MEASLERALSYWIMKRLMLRRNGAGVGSFALIDAGSMGPDHCQNHQVTNLTRAWKILSGVGI